MDETVLFFLSDGGDTRLKILELVEEAEENKEGMYLNKLSDELEISHVAARKHLQILLEEEYLKYKNPDGKPKYLELTEDGYRVLRESEE